MSTIQKSNEVLLGELTKAYKLETLRKSQSSYRLNQEDEYVDVNAIFEKLTANAPDPVAVDNYAELLKLASRSNRKPMAQICEYEKANRLAWTILVRKCEDAGERYDDVVRRTKTMAKVYENAVKWAINDPTSAYALHKCLWIYGPPGNGKTLLLEVLHELCTLLGSNKVGKVLRTDELQQKSLGTNIVSETKFDRNSFDDMGIDQPIMHYGTLVDSITSLLFVKYERWMNAGQINCFTSNYPLDPIPGADGEEFCPVRDRYGERAHSRLTQMCEPVLINFQDWRKEK